jgi:hypothetical protein
MNDEQREVAELAAKILSGVLAGAMARPNFDLGSVRPHHIQGAVNLALGLIAEVKQRVPG